MENLLSRNYTTLLVIITIAYPLREKGTLPSFGGFAESFFTGRSAKTVFTECPSETRSTKNTVDKKI